MSCARGGDLASYQEFYVHHQLLKLFFPPPQLLIWGVFDQSHSLFREVSRRISPRLLTVSVADSPRLLKFSVIILPRKKQAFDQRTVPLPRLLPLHCVPPVPAARISHPVHAFRVFTLCSLLSEVLNEALASHRKRGQTVCHFRLDLSAWVGLQLLERQT